MNKIILVEGCQGVGKTSVTNLLREKLPYTQLIRASGIRTKDIEARAKTYLIRHAELDYMHTCRNCETNFIMDRFFLSEQIYCELGYKEYDFNICFHKLCNMLEGLTAFYDIQLVILKCKEEILQHRLFRDKATYSDVFFHIEHSIGQQKEYLKWAQEMLKLVPHMGLQIYDSSLFSEKEIVNRILRD